MDSPPETPSAGLAGLRVCAFESRRQAEMQSLIQRHGGIPFIAPSLREIPLEDNAEALAAAETWLAGGFDITILLTGVGTRALVDIVATRHPREPFLAALQRTCIVVRGPKPAAVLREWRMKYNFHVPEPNTWRDLIELLDRDLPVAGQRIAVQEYGKSNLELLSQLRARGAQVTAVPVYRWALPEDIGPLQDAVRTGAAGGFDIYLFTSAQQLQHVLDIAHTLGLADAWRTAARRALIASIGPTATEMLRDHGFEPDLEPEHPKMGHLVLATARQARTLLTRKSSALPASEAERTS